MELRQYSAVVWRWKWLILACTLIGVAAAIVVSNLTTPIYAASTTLLVNEAPDSQTSGYPRVLTSARTYSRLLTTSPVLEETVRRANPKMTIGELESQVDIQLISDTQLIELTVENSNPIRAALLANTLVQVFAEQNDALQASRFAASKASLGAQLDSISEQINANEVAIAKLPDERNDAQESEFLRLQTELSQARVSYTNLLQSYEALRIAEARTISNIIQMEPAKPPGSPINARTPLSTALAGAVGAMIALGVAFLIEYLDDSIRSAEDVIRVIKLPVIGQIPNSKELKASSKKQHLTIMDSNLEVAESFRSLRTNIELAGIGGTARSILVSSPSEGDGKTTVAAQLAISIAQAGKRVVLVDANLRQPSLHAYFGIDNQLGLSDMLLDDLVPQVAARKTSSWRLRVITSGKPVNNPVELLGSVRMLQVLTRLREQTDTAIFDGPPFLVAETYILASKLESVLIVMRPGETRESEMLHITEQLERAQGSVMGVVMNHERKRSSRGFGGEVVYGYRRGQSVAGVDKHEGAPKERPVFVQDPSMEKETG